MSEKQDRSVSSRSSHSTTLLSEGIARTNPSTELPGTEYILSNESDHPNDILKRTLSLRTVISTSPSYADQERIGKASAKGPDGMAILRVIGLGSCGSVFELPGTELACKKAPDTIALWNDFLLTNKVHNAIINTREVLARGFGASIIPSTPRCSEFHTPDDQTWWDKNLVRFPQNHRAIGAAFSVDRILPVPHQTREALIARYFDFTEESQKKAKNDSDNENCLIRVYLGENETSEQAEWAYETLINFPLRLNMIEDIGLNKSDFATEMVIGLAILHRQAQIDGMDTEFVIGSSASKNENEDCLAYESTMRRDPHEVDLSSFQRRSVHLWMLDFDKADDIELSERDVDRKLIPAFLGNDPYFPRPDTDAELWREFSSHYLKASRLILE